MNREDFVDNIHGKVVFTLQGYYAYIPDNLPPNLPPSWELSQKISIADRSLSELAGATRTLPNPHLFINSFLRREAVLSSRIEGTQASLSDLFFFEAAGEREKQSDVQEVVNYVEALNYGLERLNDFPLSVRLLCEIHEKLMKGVRGNESRLTPGEVRRSQNWIGKPGSSLMNAVYVPPPVDEMKSCLGELEKYLHADSDLPPLVRLALIHYQFEAVHPFLDGNGRIGRLLITLLLIEEQLLSQPILYLSAFFERNRDDYYRLLLGVSQKAMWREWIEYFLKGVTEESKDAIIRANAVIDLWTKYRQKLQNERHSVSTLTLLDEIIKTPVMTYPKAQKILGVTNRAARQNIDKLVEIGLLREITERERYKIFVSTEIISILERVEETAPKS